jgi:drug/metabolite transporter (DMT)-like permease
LSNRREILNPVGLAHLFVVYLVWGSTYLAIRVAVRDGNGFPPFLLGASRTLAAAVLLLLWNAARRSRLRPTRGEWPALMVSGLLLWIGGNGLVNWAEQRADSGYAALLVGTTPMWVALVESAIDRRAPTWRMGAALAVGFLGLGALTYPVIRLGVRADHWAVAALLCAPLSWGIGSILQSRRPARLSPTASSAYQQLVGGVAFLLISLAIHERRPDPTLRVWLSWGYLVVAGSLIAFTSYLQALRLLPTRIVMTYAYVNPVIAVFLGWLILRERITGWTVAGTILILMGVAGVFHERVKRKEVAKAPRPDAAADTAEMARREIP